MSKTIFAGYDAKVYLEQFVEDNVFLYKLDNIEAITGEAYPTGLIVGTITAMQFAEDDVVASLGAVIDESGFPAFENETNLWIVQTAKNGISVVQGYKNLRLTGFSVGLSATDLGQSAVFQFNADRYFFPTNLKDFNESKLLLLKAAVTKLEDALETDIYCAPQETLEAIYAENATENAKASITPSENDEYFEINEETYEHVMDLMFDMIENGGADFVRVALFDTEDVAPDEELLAFDELYVYEENVEEVSEHVLDLLMLGAPDLKMFLILTNLD